MPSIRKRKLDMAMQSDEPPQKKQKTVSDDLPIIRSKLFSDELDQQQYISIFQCIEQCELIKDLNVSEAINQNIAEFATGFIECGIAECSKVYYGLYETLKANKNENDVKESFCCITNKWYCDSYSCRSQIVRNRCCKCALFGKLYLKSDDECESCLRCREHLFINDPLCQAQCKINPPGSVVSIGLCFICGIMQCFGNEQ